MSTFSGINTARRGLAAAQLGMEVTGQNIANANTEGYSRQRVEQSASVLNQTGQFSQKLVPGDGVVVNGLTRVSDALATATARQDSAAAKEQAASATIWSGIENAVGDTGTDGLSKELADLSGAWNDLVSTSGTDGQSGAQSLVITRSEAVAATLNGMSKQLQSQYDQLGIQAGNLTTEANTLAKNIAKLNTSIRETTANGASANELFDQRDQLLNQLADLTGARTVNRENGTVDVLVGNATIVTGDFSYEMKLTNEASNPMVGDQFSIEVNGQLTSPVSGSLKATLDGANVSLKDQQEKLDSFAQTLATKVNTAYGDDFFTATGDLTAKSIQVGVTNFRDSTAGTTDRTFARAVSNSFADVKSEWRTNVTTLAAATQSASNRADLSAQVSLKSASVRDGVSGVNLDEEMTNLVAYQHAYSAAARVLTSLDEALDTLINRTGLVGR
jgi:flagellar hook-associated protein 1